MCCPGHAVPTSAEFCRERAFDLLIVELMGTFRALQSGHRQATDRLVDHALCSVLVVSCRGYY
jgi:hypothetical protein